MRVSVRAAAAAAFLIVVAFLIHNVNALWLEPTYLGFEDKAKDYGDMAKIENALWSFSFTSSGIAHIVTGFAMMLLGLGVSDLFRASHPAAARLMVLAAVLSGSGFLLTGISDIPGTLYGGILRDLNPDHNETILLISTMFRGTVNVMAIACLGWFSGQVAWCTLQTGLFPKWFGYYGWFNVLPGVMSLVFPPAGFAYIQLYPVWMAALGVFMRRQAAVMDR
jgi:hypothetical protein